MMKFLIFGLVATVATALQCVQLDSANQDTGPENTLYRFSLELISDFTNAIREAVETGDSDQVERTLSEQGETLVRRSAEIVQHPDRVMPILDDAMEEVSLSSNHKIHQIIVSFFV